MIATYNWIAHAARDPKYKSDILQIMDSGSDKEIVYKKYLRIKFYGSLEFAEVQPFSKESALYSKVVPVRITYSGIRKILADEFDHILESDMQWL